MITTDHWKSAWQYGHRKSLTLLASSISGKQNEIEPRLELSGERE